MLLCVDIELIGGFLEHQARSVDGRGGHSAAHDSDIWGFRQWSVRFDGANEVEAERLDRGGSGVVVDRSVHPDWRQVPTRSTHGPPITFDFGSSTTLANQIIAGAPADVYASADLTDMDSLVSAGYVRVAPKIFTRNRMEIAVKPGNPTNIATGLSSLPTAGIVALCGPTVPCGIDAANILKRAGVTIPTSDITRQPNSTSTVQQISYGDANAAIVYVTDVNGQGALVKGVKIPLNENTIADYPIARLTVSGDTKLAQTFVAFVESHNGQRSLAAQGFLAP